ncbi:MAG: hypothetical protein UT02_C0004G0013 [Parcubacteria group bacterium GW2011_GWC2_38_7]|nr:MAG: hypothetical protein UT02_C0004G0013 [Parcubacteria group bacterium GW2011_GWC2_38_7]
MFIIDNSFSFTPYIDFDEQKAPNIDKLLQNIEEYIYDKARKSIVDGQTVRVINISGLANYHHTELANYLKSNKHNCLLESGEFGTTPVKHCWLKVDDFLVDLTLKQFEDSQHSAPSFLRSLFNTHCFISNRPQSLIYQLYRKIDE